MAVAADPPVEARTRRGSALRWARGHMRVLAPMATLLALVIFFSFASGGSFFSVTNGSNILAQVSPLAALAIGETFVILTGEIDLSVANVAVMGTVILASVFGGPPGMGPAGLGWPEGIAIVAAIAACTAAGFVSGFISQKLNIVPFMVTLAMMEIALGIVTYVTSGQVLYLKSPSITNSIGSDYVGSTQFPVIAVVAIALLAVAYFTLNYTRFGRYIYMVGGNREAAELSGVNTKRIIMLALTISGLCAGIASVMYTGRLGTAQPSGLGDILIYCIAAVVLGGTSLLGGEGGIQNTIIGLLILGVLQTGLDQVSINIYTKTMIYGIILMVALVINVYARKLETTDAA